MIVDLRNSFNPDEFVKSHIHHRNKTGELNNETGV